MTEAGLFGIYADMTVPAADDDGAPLFAVRPVAGHNSYFVGKDNGGRACFLVATADASEHKPPPIRLESLDAQFELCCRITDAAGQVREGSFTVVRCRSLDRETIRYFLSVCRIIMRHLGDTPTRSAVGAAVNRLAAIFAKLQQPPTRSLNGLFGELFLIRASGNPRRALSAWRIDDKARFDFSDGDVRLEVKTTSNHVRAHTFSYEQCNPPAGTLAVVASIFVERAAAGMIFGTLIGEIEHRVAGDADLVFKLHDIIVATLGTGLKEALSIGFDEQLARSSLQFFEIDQVPAIRDSIPAGVSEVRFRSDLSATPPMSARALIDRDPVFWDLLPK